MGGFEFTLWQYTCAWIFLCLGINKSQSRVPIQKQIDPLGHNKHTYTPFCLEREMLKSSDSLDFTLAELDI